MEVVITDMDYEDMYYEAKSRKILANGSSSELADNPIVKKYYLGDNFKL